MNASPEGFPLDTQIRIMQVRALDRLQDKSIHAIWTQTREILGPDLLWSATHTVTINKGLDLSLEVAPGAQHLVIAAWLRNPAQGSFWRSVRIPVNYQVGTCAKEREYMPDPCAFAAIGERGVTFELEPPGDFNRTGIHARCPSMLLLRTASQPPRD